MNKVIKSIIFTVLAAFIVFGAVACKKSEQAAPANTDAAPQEAAPLYVGTNAEFEPFEYLDNGEIVGFDIDLINEIGKLIGREIVIKNIAFDGLLPAMQQRKLDIVIAGMTANDERRKSVNFSTPYFVSKQAMLVDKDNKDITVFDNLPGHKVGVVLGYTGDVIVTEIEGVDVQRYNGSSEAVMALKAKKVDAVVIDYEPAKNYAKYNDTLKLLETDLAQEEYSIAIPKDEPELLEQINKALQTLKDNGTYDALIQKYFDK